MKSYNIDFKTSDSVRVKSGVKCHGYESLCIEDWRGRIKQITATKKYDMLVEIEWDSITLLDMPVDFIKHCEDNELEFGCMFLEPDEIEIASKRDTKADVAKITKKIAHDYIQKWEKEKNCDIQ